MAENTTRMLWVLCDNPRDMKHVQAESILNSSEKSGDKYFGKKLRARNISTKNKIMDLHSTHWLKHGQYNCKKGWGSKTYKEPLFYSLIR
jgi:hypothetical protein